MNDSDAPSELVCADSIISYFHDVMALFFNGKSNIRVKENKVFTFFLIQKVSFLIFHSMIPTLRAVHKLHGKPFLVQTAKY